MEFWQKLAAREPIVWTGDLSDDCAARWAGLLLRAECMGDTDGGEEWWWWAVYDLELPASDAQGTQVAAWNEEGFSCTSGEQARQTAERAAQQYLRSWPAPPNA